MHTFGLVCTIIGVGIVALYALQALLSLSPLRIKAGHTTQPFKERWKTTAKVLLIVAGVLVAAGAGLLAAFPQPAKSNPQSPQAKNTRISANASTVKFSNPHGTTLNPLLVSCQQDIEITGQMPKGYEFAVGNVIAGQNDDIEFVPEGAATLVAANTWKIRIVFGTAANSGSKFNVYLEVLPTQQLNYLVAEAQSIREFLGKGNYAGQTWWRSPGLPPSPAIAEDYETAQRMAVTTGCPSS